MNESTRESSSGATRNETRPASNEGDAATPQGETPAADELIRMRAYALYRERAGGIGDDMSDWLRAEQEYLEHSGASAGNGSAELHAASSSARNG